MTATDVVVALNEPEVLKLDFQHGARVLRALDLDCTWIVRARHLSTRPQTAPNSLQWLTARSNEAAPGTLSGCQSLQIDIQRRKLWTYDIRVGSDADGSARLCMFYVHRTHDSYLQISALASATGR